MFSVSRMRCCGLKNPIGIDTAEPYFSYELSARDGCSQSAYRIGVASSADKLESGKPDLWDSGKVISDKSIFIDYEGKPLGSRDRAYWRVQVWNGDETAESEIAFFEIALLHASDFQAHWISAKRGDGFDWKNPAPAPLLRREFILEKPVAKARAYMCALGFGELHINGAKMGDAVLSTPFTAYDNNVLYEVLDISGALRQGANCVGVMLGNGWYNTFIEDVWDFIQAPWRDAPKLLLQLEWEHTDGTRGSLLSSPEWESAAGPIVFNGIRNGEFYDARLEKRGWDRAGYDAAEWSRAAITRSPGGTLRAAMLPPIRVTESIRPKAMWRSAPGVYTYDVGRAISGFVRLRIKGEPGERVKIRYAERLDDEMRLDAEDIGKFVKSGEFQTDSYTLRTNEVEVWQPHFVYHGFRYVELSGVSREPALESVHVLKVHTDIKPAGAFECSDELVNSIQKAAINSTLCNFHSIPTDCPHREKNGWTGDASLSCEQAVYNLDMRLSYHKWLRDILDAQRPSGQLPGIVPTGGWGYNWGSGPAWDSALILIPWYLYVYEGDVKALELCYDGIKRYMSYISSMANDYIVDFGLGDWCPPVGGSGGHECPSVVTDTGYYSAFASTVERIANVLGDQIYANEMSALALAIKSAFNKQFVNKSTGIVMGDCQTSQACALYHGLLEGETAEKAFECMLNHIINKDYHIDTGILGAKYVMQVLTDRGRADIAYRMITQRTFPGWGYMIENGATALWEMWNGDESRLHHMYSDVSSFFYKALAGIKPNAYHPGFKCFEIAPQPVDGLSWARAWHRCPYGIIKVEWQLTQNTFKLNVEVPAGTTALVRIPSAQGEKRVSVGPGRHEFKTGGVNAAEFIHT